jgi:hypothetical protein
MLDIDMLCKDRDSCVRAGSILPHYIGGIENLEANVLKQPIPTITLGSKFFLKDQEIHVLVNRLV